MAKQGTTKVLTLGVPLDIYAELDHGEIKNLFLEKLDDKLEFKIRESNGKLIYLSIRLPIDKIDKVKYLADFYKVTIIEMTANILLS